MICTDAATRSVLIYVEDKPAAFDAFGRVLRPGGRLSLFEPVNREMRRLNGDVLFDYDIRAVSELADKVREVHDRQTPTHSAMLDFDGGDLAQLAATAGFETVVTTSTLRSAMPLRCSVAEVTKAQRSRTPACSASCWQTCSRSVENVAEDHPTLRAKPLQRGEPDQALARVRNLP